MMDPLLKAELLAVFRRQRRLQLALRLAGCWGGLALVGLLLPPSPAWRFALAALGVVAGGIVFAMHRRTQPDWPDLARRIELRFPELDGVLLTAVQQQPAGDGQFQYLQERIVREALDHGGSQRWTATIPWSHAAAAQSVHLVALGCFVCVLAALPSPRRGPGVFSNGWTADGVTITPGDISIERGERLVVVASFAGSLPANVNLVTTFPAEQPKRTPLVKSLSDPVFGGSVSDVATDFVYRVEYGDRRSRDFAVKVFEYPRLERADAELTFPEYTGLAPKRIENTRRISAVEGSRCTLTLQLNKPVARAQFVAKGDAGETIPLVVASNSPVATLAGLLLETNRTYLLQLVDADGRTNKLPAQFVVDVLKNREPELKIASPRGDTRPSALEEISFEGTVWDDFGVQAYGLAYAEAGGEIQFVELGQGAPGKEKRAFKHLLRLEDIGAKPDQLITWFLWAEDIGPDGQIRRSAGDLYFAEVRPFDEIFRQGQGGGGEQSSGGGEQQAGGGGSPQTKLAELQKQIINATWKLQRQQSRQITAPPAKKPATSGKSSGATSANEFGLRRQSEAATALSKNEDHIAPMHSPDSGVALRFPPQSKIPLLRPVFGQRTSGNSADTPLARVREKLAGVSGTNKTASTSQFVNDLGVVRDAVAEALSQAQAGREQQAGDRNAVLWDELIRDLEKAQAALEKAAQTPSSLTEALAAEQSAFQILLRLQQREYEVSRNRSRSQSGQSSREQQMQRQLDQLDLTQPENRYETERLAQPPQSAERREQLQVMNRLSELARRQQDLNERLKELQTALQEAQTEKEREEIRRQLKRLQEEEQQMLADADELQQRMNQPENQSRMNEQRQQLEQTRQEMQRAADAAQRGSVSQALASGTRAQRQLQQMREEMRKQSAGEFAEELKQLRAEARAAERKQQEIQKLMDSFSGRGQKSLDDSQERQKALDELGQQMQRLTNLVERATQLSQQTEAAEPLVSRELYDSLRKFSQDDANSIRRLQDELIERGLFRTELYQRLSQLEKSDGVKSVELTREMLQQGLLPQAQQAGDRTRAAVRDLASGVERAAEKVLGDDTEALRLARQQLDQLTEQIEREMAQGQGAGGTNGQAQAGSGQPQPTQTGSPRGNGQPSPNPQTAGAENQPPPGTPGEAVPGQAEAPAGEGNQNAQAGAAREGSTTPGPNPGANRGARSAAPRGGDGNAGSLPSGLEQFLSGERGGPRNGPVITGDEFVPWADGLREVEEMVDDPLLQNRLATVRERARLMRQEYKRTREKPDWTQVNLQVLKPLVEVRNQIAEELARRGSRENLVPIDRDPVPGRFSELVRRYYEELGKDK